MDAMLLTTSMSSPILNCQKLKRTFKQFNETAFAKDMREVDWSVTQNDTETGFENFLLITNT